MSEIDIHIMHPTDGRIISVTLDPTITVSEVIVQLITAEFIPPSEQGYNLAIKGGSMLQNEQSLKEGNVSNDETLRVIPATNAG